MWCILLGRGGKYIVTSFFFVNPFSYPYIHILINIIVGMHDNCNAAAGGC